MAEDGSNNSQQRRLKSSVADRIRSRAERSGSSGDGSGSSGDGRGSSGNDSGNRSGDNHGTGTDANRIDVVDGNQQPSDEIGNGLRIVGQSSNRRTKRIRDAGSNGDNRASDNGDGTNDTRQLVSEKPSVIRADDIISPVQPKRGRGRPPKDAPKKIKPANAPDYSDIVFPLSIALDFVFNIPVALGGKQFNFWELDDDEKSDLVDSVKDVLEAFPSDSTEQFIKALEKWIPLLTLGMNLYAIMKPRLIQTQEIIKEKRKAAANAKNEQTEKRTTPVPFDNYRREAV